MSSDITIAFDVMGGDQGSRPCVCAAEIFARRYPSVRLVLFGEEAFLRAALSESLSNIEIVHVADHVAMDDSPSKALRHKRHSSMAQALEYLAKGRADACVSAGNTGALMALARHFVKTQEGVKRPAICKEIPTKQGTSLLLDLGANISCNSEHLVQFACMGSALARAKGCARPKVALLNVGSEVTKGTMQIKRAAAILQHMDAEFEFLGYIEGSALYTGRADVIVCDGFVGNVALKVSEGLAVFILESLHAFFATSVRGRLLKLLFGPALRAWSRKKNPSLYNGAAFLGLGKIVVKSHGGADIPGLVSALETARDQVLTGVLTKINQDLDATV